MKQQRKQVRVNIHCPADCHAGAGEKIIEFSANRPDGSIVGGLVSFRISPEGSLRVEVYRCGPGVLIVAGPITAEAAITIPSPLRT